MNEATSFYLNQEEPNRSCLLAIRKIILERNHQIRETKKYGMPCFTFRGKAFCYLWIDKKSSDPYVLFVEGKYLEHPNLEVGKRSRMKIFRLNPEKDIPIKSLTMLLNQALDLYISGKIKTK